MRRWPRVRRCQASATEMISPWRCRRLRHHVPFRGKKLPTNSGWSRLSSVPSLTVLKRSTLHRRLGRLEQRLGGDCSFLIPAPTAKMRALGERVVRSAAAKPRRLAFVDGQARQVMLQAHAAAVASGTATLEACLMRCPTVLVYTASFVTFLVAKLLVKGVRHLGLANIIAGREVMPELLQHDFTPERLCDLLYRSLTDADARRQTLADLDATNALLGDGNASGRAADAIVGRFAGWLDETGR